MASFRIVEHTIPGQHVREYPHATRSGQDECLQLAVKQYVPGIVEEPGPEDVTIVTSHANGFPKVSPPVIKFSMLKSLFWCRRPMRYSLSIYCRSVKTTASEFEVS